nr:hypothetical protein [uncultured Acetatifactor sp.]
MNQWVNVTDTFSESQRHYKNTYLEICEVFDEVVELRLFSSEEDPYEIYFSFGIMYGIVYVQRDCGSFFGADEFVKILDFFLIIPYND